MTTRVFALAAFAALVSVPAASAQSTIRSPQSEAASPVRFEKRILTDKYYCDGINCGDFNRDGRMDIVAGPFWYEGPDFKFKHEIYPPKEFPKPPSPTDSLFSFVYDFNGDGWPDVLVIGRVHLHQAFWYENPKGKPGHWAKHFVQERVQAESPAFTDIDQDGRPEIVCIWNKQWGLVKPDWNDPARPWTFQPIIRDGDWTHFYHGTGVGDVNGDGRPDLIINDGWWERPASPNTDWIPHRFVFSKDKGGAQMFAYDVNGDGHNDIITSLNAHGWGLAWFEQVKENGAITFREHKIAGDRSEEARFGVAFTQPHAMDLVDIDGDGLKDIVVGKRMWAHGPEGDIEPGAAPVLYWFQLTRGKNRQVKYVPHLIDSASGVGTQVVAADVNGDGRPDILTVSKLGAFVFINHPSDRASLNSPASAIPSALNSLGTDGSRFTINGRPTFLLGISYYGGLGAAKETLRADLDDMQAHGFNWLRVWATWGQLSDNVSAVNADGTAREPYFTALKELVGDCDRRGLIVDVTFTRGKGAGGLATFDAHERAVQTIVEALKSHRNWYLDLGNERDVRDDRYVSVADLKKLRDLVRRLDPDRLVTASFGGHDLTESDIRDAVLTVGVDFLVVHRPRDAGSAEQTEAQTRACLKILKQIGRTVPVLQQEPFRRGYTKWEPVAGDFLTDLRGAIAGGAAGWCFHNGSQRNTSDHEQRRSFDLRTRRLFDQLDAEEMKVVKAAGIGEIKSRR